MVPTFAKLKKSLFLRHSGPFRIILDRGTRLPIGFLERSRVVVKDDQKKQKKCSMVYCRTSAFFGLQMNCKF